VLEPRDHAAIRELKRELAVVGVTGGGPLDHVLPAMTEALGAEKVVVYRARANHDTWALDFSISHGLRSRAKAFADDLDATLHTLDRFGFYDPARVETGQQNVAVAFSSVRRLTGTDLPRSIDALRLTAREKDRRFEGARQFGHFFARWDMDDDCQLRALVCDGPALLAWVGGLRAAPFDARATQVLRALVIPLRDRLRVEARLGRLGVAIDPLSRAVLEHVAGAGFVVDARGSVVIANAAGYALLDRAPRETRALLRPAAPPRADVSVTSVDLAAHGVGLLRLVLVQEEARRAEHAARVVAGRHGLTPRETEVLALLARGASNLRIAHSLGCAERTVEVHVARVLTKLDCATRAEAIARTLA